MLDDKKARAQLITAFKKHQETVVKRVTGKAVSSSG